MVGPTVDPIVVVVVVVGPALNPPFFLREEADVSCGVELNKKLSSKHPQETPGLVPGGFGLEGWRRSAFWRALTLISIFNFLVLEAPPPARPTRTPGRFSLEESVLQSSASV